MPDPLGCCSNLPFCQHIVFFEQYASTQIAVPTTLFKNCSETQHISKNIRWGQHLRPNLSYIPFLLWKCPPSSTPRSSTTTTTNNARYTYALSDAYAIIKKQNRNHVLHWYDQLPAVRRPSSTQPRTPGWPSTIRSLSPNLPVYLTRSRILSMQICSHRSNPPRPLPYPDSPLKTPNLYKLRWNSAWIQTLDHIPMRLHRGGWIH